jgi:hypothetical protein
MILARDQVDSRLHGSYGFGLTKMIAFWHSPFERFLHIDADTVCWGDILKDLPWKGCDFIYNEPHEIITPSILRSQYFKPEELFKIIPEFGWEVNPYFNTGCFVARRGILDLEYYLELLDIQKRRPEIFIPGEQGILNLMVFQQVALGKIKARSWPLQAVVSVIPPGELDNRFRVSKGRPIVKDTDRRVIHWAGAKPYLTREAMFPQPMVYYRLEHLRNVHSPRRYLGRLGLILEEMGERIAVRYDGSYPRALRSKGRWIIGQAAKSLRLKQSIGT